MRNFQEPDHNKTSSSSLEDPDTIAAHTHANNLIMMMDPMSDDDRDIDIESDEDDNDDSDTRSQNGRGPNSTQHFSQAEKRAHHNALERKRRDHIKDSFNSLRESVPSLAGDKSVSLDTGANQRQSKASRAQILRKAAEFIQFMRRKNQSHQQNIEDLKRQNNILESQIRQLEQQRDNFSTNGDLGPPDEITESEGEEEDDEEEDDDEEDHDVNVGHHHQMINQQQQQQHIDVDDEDEDVDDGVSEDGETGGGGGGTLVTSGNVSKKMKMSASGSYM